MCCASLTSSSCNRNKARIKGFQWGWANSKILHPGTFLTLLLSGNSEGKKNILKECTRKLHVLWRVSSFLVNLRTVFCSVSEPLDAAAPLCFSCRAVRPPGLLSFAASLAAVCNTAARWVPRSSSAAAAVTVLALPCDDVVTEDSNRQTGPR